MGSLLGCGVAPTEPLREGRLAEVPEVGRRGLECFPDSVLILRTTSLSDLSLCCFFMAKEEEEEEEEEDCFCFEAVAAGEE